MANILTFIFFLFCISACAHKIVTVTPNIPPGSSFSLIDTAIKYTFTLDTSHTSIIAYDSVRHVVWKTNPLADNKIENDRGYNYITQMMFREWPHDGMKKKGLFIRYGRMTGYLDLKTGKFHLDAL